MAKDMKKVQFDFGRVNVWHEEEANCADGRSEAKGSQIVTACKLRLSTTDWHTATEMTENWSVLRANMSFYLSDRSIKQIKQEKEKVRKEPSKMKA